MGIIKEDNMKMNEIYNNVCLWLKDYEIDTININKTTIFVTINSAVSSYDIPKLEETVMDICSSKEYKIVNIIQKDSSTLIHISLSEPLLKNLVQFTNGNILDDIEYIDYQIKELKNINNTFKEITKIKKNKIVKKSKINLSDHQEHNITFTSEDLEKIKPLIIGHNEERKFIISDTECNEYLKTILNPKEFIVVYNRHILKKTFKDISEILGLSSQYTRQIESSVFKKLKHPVRTEKMFGPKIKNI